MKRKAKRKETINYVPLLGFLLLLILSGFLITKLPPTGFVVSSSGTTYVNLTIWFNQTNNINSQIPIHTQINFTANFTNQTGSVLFAENMSCNFTQNSSGSWSAPINMTYDPITSLYYANMSFANTGMFTYNITCFGNETYSFENVSLTEEFTVTNCVPPTSGDWLINESANIVCANKPSLQINGSVNVTNANLTLVNSTINLTRLNQNNASLSIRSSTLYANNSGTMTGSNMLLNLSGISIVSSSSLIISDSALTLLISTINSSGDWIIENSSTVVCENIPYMQINGSINVTDDSNFTMINSTFNSSAGNIYLINTSNLFMSNSSSLMPVRSFDNSSLTIHDNSYLILADIYNYSRLHISSSEIKTIFFKPDDDFSFENLTANRTNNVVLSSLNIIYNMSDSIIEFININGRRDQNISKSNITAIFMDVSKSVRISSSDVGGLLGNTNDLIILTHSNVGNLFSLYEGNMTGWNSTISSMTINANATAILNSVAITSLSFNPAGSALLFGNFTIINKNTYLDSTVNVTRFFPVFIYNGANETNGTLNITHNGQVIWQGSLNNSYALVNITFNSTTYTNQYSMNTPIGYVGKISLLDNTPIIKTTAVSSIPLIASLLTANGTLFNDTAYLQFSSNKDLTCQYSLEGDSPINATKTQSYFKLFNGTYLRYNNTLSSSYPMLNSTQLPFILTQNIFTEFLGSNDNDVAYTEELRLGNNAKLSLFGQGANPYPINKNATTYLYFENETANNLTYNYLLIFNNSIIYNNFSQQTASDDLINSRIKIQGIQYNISLLTAGGSGNAISDMTLTDGTTSLKLRGGSGKIQINGTDISNAYGYFMGTPGNWTGINITYYPNDRIYLAEGDAYTDQVFGKLKFVFTKLNVASTENISFKSDKQNITINFTDVNNSLISIPYFNVIQASRGYNATRPILIKGENYAVSTAGEEIGMVFYYVKNITGEVHLLRLSVMDIENHTLDFVDDAYNINYTNKSYYNSTDNLSIISLGTLGNITLNISENQRQINYQDAPRISAKTKYGADITLTQSGLLFNENNSSANNVTLEVNITNDANWTYDSTNTLTKVSKIYGDNTIKLANTKYGTMIEDNNQNHTYITITHPQTSTYADVYLAGADVDNASLIAGTLPLSARYSASSNYTYNNLSLTCTDGVETKYFSLNVNISKTPSLTAEETSTTIESATINITTDIVTRMTLRYGTTSAISNLVSFNNSAAAHGIYLPGLASDTNYYYNLTICDIYERCIVTGPNSFITQHRESNPTSNELNYVDINTITNTDPFANRRFADIISGEKYSSEMNFGKVPVTKVEFTAKKDLDAAVFSFFKLKNSSEATSLSEPEKIYAYMRFNLTKASFEDITDVRITFRLEKTWFDQNNFTKDSITLNHYGGQWVELNTEYEKQDPFYHYYKTKVSGFSIFAITATKGKLPTTAQQTSTPADDSSSQTPTTQPSQPIQPSPPVDYEQNNPNTNNANEPDTEEPSNISPSIVDKIKELTQNALFTPIAIAILALALVGGGVVIARRPKSMIQELARKQMTNQEVINELKAKGVYGQALEEMRQFISASIHQGKNSNEIKAALLSVGWEEHIIDDVFQLFNVH